jgi:hypothetical protein
MPSYSNYPYPYAFENSEEQMDMAAALREKVASIKAKKPEDNYMVYKNGEEGLRIDFCMDGKKRNYRFNGTDQALYIAAVEELKAVKTEAARLEMSLSEATGRLQNMEAEGLVLFSLNRENYLSLATKKT